MPVVNVHQAKTQLSRLLAQVEAGEDVEDRTWLPSNLSGLASTER